LVTEVTKGGEGERKTGSPGKKVTPTSRKATRPYLFGCQGGVKKGGKIIGLTNHKHERRGGGGETQGGRGKMAGSRMGYCESAIF